MKGLPDNVMDKADFTCRVLNAESSLYRVAKTILINNADCEDAVQETILRAWERQSTLRHPVGGGDPHAYPLQPQRHPEI